jgi:hypothetical protein
LHSGAGRIPSNLKSVQTPRTLFAETVRDSFDCDDPALVCGRGVGECVGNFGAGEWIFGVARGRIARFCFSECNAIEFDPAKSSGEESGGAKSDPGAV